GGVGPGRGGGGLAGLGGEVGGVLEQVSEAVKDGGVAAADRFGRFARRQCDVDRNAEVAVRGNHLFDQRGQLHAVERRAAREFGQLRQDGAAGLGLLGQEPDVGGVVGSRLGGQCQ